MSHTVSGFVLSGGRSSRFGSNKLLHHVGEKPMGLVVYDNLKSAIQSETFFVGPVIDHPDFAGMPRITGSREGQGPLGAICDVLENANTELVIFAPCDTPYFFADQFRQLSESLGQYSVVVSADTSTPHLRHWLLSCWNVELAKDHMISAFESGERAIHRAVVGLNVRDQFFSEQLLTNINTPLDAQ